MDEHRVPESIEWSASDTGAAEMQKAKAFMLSFWDGADKTALRIDLWTKDMMVDEMADFFLPDHDDYGRYLWSGHQSCGDGRGHEEVCAHILS